MAFSDARAQVPDPDVLQLAPTRRTPDTSAAQAIKAVSQFGGKVRQTRLLEDQREEFGQLANEVSVLQDEATFIDRDAQGRVVDVDLSFTPGSEDIDEVSTRFRALAAGIKQGRVSQTSVQVQAEVILRQAIARAPGFAPEFRQQARELLGFDPSGSAIRAMLGLNEEPVEINPFVEQARNIAEASDISFETALSLGVKQAVNEMQLTILRGQTARGQITANRASVEYANIADIRATDVLRRALDEFALNGSIADPAPFIADLDNVVNQVILDMRTAMIEGGVVNPADLKAAQEFVRARFEPVKTFIVDNDLLKISSRNKEIVANLYSVMGARLFPGLKLVSEFGDGAVNAYLEWLQVANGDPVKMEELMKANPKLRTINQADLQAQEMGAIIDRLIRRLPTDQFDPATVGFVTAAAQVSGDDVLETAATQKTLDQGNVNEGLGYVGQKVDSHATANEDLRASVRNQFPGNQQQLENTLSERLVGTPFKLGFRNGLFDLVDVDDPSISGNDLAEFSEPQIQLVSRGRRGLVGKRQREEFGIFTDQFGQDVALPGGGVENRSERDRLRSQINTFRDDLEKLNAAQWAVVRKPEWPEELGFTRQEYLLKTLERVNSQAALDSSLLAAQPQLDTQQLEGINDLIAMGRGRIQEGRVLENEDGSISSLRTASVQVDELNNGAITLIPTISGSGKQLTVDEAIDAAIRSGRNFPIFRDEAAATAVSNFISDNIRNSIVQDTGDGEAQQDTSNLIPAKPGDTFVDPDTGEVITVPELPDSLEEQNKIAEEALKIEDLNERGLFLASQGVKLPRVVEQAIINGTFKP